jgi:hypothetical protein
MAYLIEIAGHQDDSKVTYPIKKIAINSIGEIYLTLNKVDNSYGLPLNATRMTGLLQSYIRSAGLDGGTRPSFTVEESKGKVVLKFEKPDQLLQIAEVFSAFKFISEKSIKTFNEKIKEIEKKELSLEAFKQLKL